ncbi:hypothetical protein Glove_33g47 [Diversispora epigaea]|uniref:Uncharacterized protein n=1 Tax=Diversispora epigaea TaxID=1348612 RepID=A0A397JGM7_9GLOM|nr:hypothetical protein Glove_33g47 [Diversispora epigaea]
MTASTSTATILRKSKVTSSAANKNPNINSSVITTNNCNTAIGNISSHSQQQQRQQNK